MSDDAENERGQIEELISDLQVPTPVNKERFIREIIAVNLVPPQCRISKNYNKVADLPPYLRKVYSVIISKTLEKDNLENVAAMDGLPPHDGENYAKIKRELPVLNSLLTGAVKKITGEKFHKNYLINKNWEVIVPKK